MCDIHLDQDINTHRYILVTSLVYIEAITMSVDWSISSMSCVGGPTSTCPVLKDLFLIMDTPVALPVRILSCWAFSRASFFL
mmetsp:Transcript_30964/g.36474  ORF Transcript_30964/g.36474 Transcript_30964/m.36474 type:complete len:82 (+) Transcript_30964:67-312(+)